MSNNKVDVHAYAIPLLHAAKYPSSAVCGVLLGTNTTDGLQVKTAVPFFHHWTTLTPMLEVALKLVKKKKKTRAFQRYLVFNYLANYRQICTPKRTIGLL